MSLIGVPRQYGKTALNLAEEEGYKEMIALLKAEAAKQARCGSPLPLAGCGLRQINVLISRNESWQFTVSSGNAVRRLTILIVSSACFFVNIWLVGSACRFRFAISDFGNLLAASAGR